MITVNIRIGVGGDAWCLPFGRSEASVEGSTGGMRGISVEAVDEIGEEQRFVVKLYIKITHIIAMKGSIRVIGFKCNMWNVYTVWRKTRIQVFVPGGRVCAKWRVGRRVDLGILY